MTCTARRHGTRSAYQAYGCRCPEAREAKRLYDKRMKHGLQPSASIPVVGAARRLQALATLGWSMDDLAELLRCNRGYLSALRLQYKPRIHVATHRRIDDLYRRLWDKPGPSPRAAADARARGWAPPLAWGRHRRPQRATTRHTTPIVRPEEGNRMTSEHTVELEVARLHARQAGTAWLGQARQVQAGRGRHGLARPGLAGLGAAGQGRHG